MGWCPNCQNEYVEGIKICPKCEVDLVESLEQTGNSNNAMNAHNVSAGNQEEQPGAYTIQIPVNTLPDEETIKRAIELQRNMHSSTVYQKKSAKAEDMKSSAISLLLVGFIGLVLVILVFFDIIPLNFSLYRKIMITSVMAVLFIILIIVGLFSIKSFKLLKKSAGEEDLLTEEIKNWYTSSLSKEVIDKDLDIEDGDDEADLYYLRHGRIVALLNNKFLNLDEGYSELMVEEIYNFIYED